jgi:putative aldouronate transport system permease protein
MKRKFLNQIPLHLILLPGIVITLIYCYWPMLGMIMAFEDYNPAMGFLHSPWVGLANFTYIFSLPNIFQVMWNTVFIAVLKIMSMIIVPVVVALLLNEISMPKLKKSIQTLIYFPHFMSWVIVAGIMVDILSPKSGIINSLLTFFGSKPIFFLGNEHVFPYVMVFSDVWKEFGFGAIIYLAALTGIDPALYEAAKVDGASRWRQTLNVTLPGLLPTIVLLGTLSLGNVLNAGFDQIFNLYSPQVYSTGDIIDTMVYRMGLIQLQFSTATAVGILKSVISCALIIISYKLADKYAKYRIF